MKASPSKASRAARKCVICGKSSSPRTHLMACPGPKFAPKSA